MYIVPHSEHYKPCLQQVDEGYRWLFGWLIVFYGISTLVGYLGPIHINTYVLDIYALKTNCLIVTFLKELGLICLQMFSMLVDWLLCLIAYQPL